MQADPAVALEEATKGTVRMSDVLDLMVGLLPLLDEDPTARSEEPEVGVRYTFPGPKGTEVRALVDPVQGTPIHVEVDDPKGKLAVTADYAPFVPLDPSAEAEAQVLVPGQLVLYVPAVDLTVDLKFKGWAAPEQAPDVFSPEIPGRYEVLAMQDFLAGMSESVGGAE